MGNTKTEEAKNDAFYFFQPPKPYGDMIQGVAMAEAMQFSTLDFLMPALSHEPCPIGARHLCGGAMFCVSFHLMSSEEMKCYLYIDQSCIKVELRKKQPMTDRMRILPHYFDDPEFQTLAPSNALLTHRTKVTKQLNADGDEDSQDKKVDEGAGAPKADAPFSEKEVTEFQDSIAELKYTSLQMEKDVAKACEMTDAKIFLTSALSRHLERQFKWSEQRRMRLFTVLRDFMQYRPEKSGGATQLDVISHFT